MEKPLLRIFSSIILIIGLVLFLNNTGGPTNTDATGSPFDSNQNACTQCHTTYSLNSGTGSVSINAPATYYPGESYSVTVTVEQSVPTPAKYGFQAVALRDNNNAGGTFSTGSGQGSWTSGGRSYIQHNSTANTTGNFTFTWNAPSYADTVIFYAGGLAANGGNGNANDYVYTGTTTVLPIQPITFSEDSIGTSCPESCDGSASVDVTGGGVPPYTYAWSSGETTDSISGKCSGTYTVTITDDDGHEEIAEIEIIQPDPIQAIFQTLPSSCAFGDGQISVSAVGGAGGYSYQWNDTANTTDSVIMQAGLGFFTVTITDSTGCSIVDSAEITASNSGLTGFFTIDNENCGQVDGSATLTMFAGNPPYSFAWSDGSSGSNIVSDLESGTYTVTVIDNIGCIETFETSVGEDFLVINEDSTVLTDVRCFNGQDGGIKTSILSGEQPYIYSWSHDSTANASQLNNLSGGQYTITVEDQAGCSDSATFMVSQPDSVYAVTESTGSNEDFCDGTISIEMFGGTPPYTYSWPHDENLSGSTAQELCAGNYLITASDALGCLYLVTASVEELLVVKEIIQEDIVIYPNPATNQVQVFSPSKGQLEIIDVTGKVVYNCDVSNKKAIDISVFDSGIYTVMLKTEEGRSSKVLVIDR